VRQKHARGGVNNGLPLGINGFYHCRKKTILINKVDQLD
jgi:hypothetical protein